MMQSYSIIVLTQTLLVIKNTKTIIYFNIPESYHVEVLFSTSGKRVSFGRSYLTIV